MSKKGNKSKGFGLCRSKKGHKSKGSSSYGYLPLSSGKSMLEREVDCANLANSIILSGGMK